MTQNQPSKSTPPQYSTRPVPAPCPHPRTEAQIPATTYLSVASCSGPPCARRAGTRCPAGWRHRPPAAPHCSPCWPAGVGARTTDSVRPYWVSVWCVFLREADGILVTETGRHDDRACLMFISLRKKNIDDRVERVHLASLLLLW